MSLTSFNIDAKEVVALTHKLEQLNRYSMPLAVRNTLNEAAFIAKTKEIGKTFDSQFTIRRKGFIKSHSGFKRSPGTLDINRMISRVGVLGKDNAGRNLAVQEKGGSIRRRRIPTKHARVSSSEARLVSKRNFFQKLKGKRGDYHTVNGKTYLDTGRYVVQISKRGKIKVMYIQYKTAKIKKAPFVAPAALLASKSIPTIFRTKAEQQIRKVLSR